MSKDRRNPENKHWRRVVQEDMECEGAFEAFRDYDHYEWVEDEHFHRLRKVMLDSYEELCAYVGFDP